MMRLTRKRLARMTIQQAASLLVKRGMVLTPMPTRLIDGRFTTRYDVSGTECSVDDVRNLILTGDAR